MVTPWGNKGVAWRKRQCKEQCQVHAGEEGHARPGWTTSRRGQDSPWNSQSEWQRTWINGESTSMVWPTLGSRTAKEQNILMHLFTLELSSVYVLWTGLRHLVPPLNHDLVQCTQFFCLSTQFLPISYVYDQFPIKFLRLAIIFDWLTVPKIDSSTSWQQWSMCLWPNSV